MFSYIECALCRSWQQRRTNTTCRSRGPRIIAVSAVRFGCNPEGSVEIQLSLRLSVSQPITNRLHYSHSDFNQTTKQKIGPPADTVILTSSGITAREPQQTPVLVFSITLTQKRVCPPVWIILVLHAELAIVKTLLVKGLYHLNILSTFELVCDVLSLLHAHTQTKSRKCKCKFSRTHIDVACTHTHTHTQTPTQEHMHTTPSES